ncbi:ABC transporter permease [Halovenus salina]|uniref:ABC transporter permease n=1 Tax=Halovenus salina TaxID=1510225 RepID=UPI002260C21E|nr:ABC transporter permease [Halovenus salina]
MRLTRFFIRRTLQGVLVIWGVVTIVFLLRFITPGSPIDFVAPIDASPELRQSLAENLGLDKPIYQQYGEYVFNLIQGDMGYSFQRGLPASEIIFRRLPATLELAVAATVVAITFSIPLGVISATRRNEPVDYAATSFSLVGISTPNFWLGIMLILVVGVQIDLLPTSRRIIGFGGALELLVTEQNFLGLRVWLSHIILPAVTLGTYFTALIVRLTRSGMLEELGKSYVEASRAKGLPETLVTYKHVLRNTMIPIITVLGLQLGTLIGGAVITESVFDWPGLGTLVIDSIRQRDWPVIQGSIIVIGLGFVVINVVVDALYAYLNPRVELE